MFDVVGVGNLDVDIYIQLDSIPSQDEKILANHHQYHVGGMIANTMVATSRLGLKSTLHAPIGDDHNGKLATQGMEENGVNIAGVIKKPNGKTYFCVVMVDKSGEKSLIVVPTDCMDLKSDDFSTEIITSAKHVHTILFDDVEIAIEIAKANGMTVSMDIEPNMLLDIDSSRLKNILQKLDILFLGEDAAKKIGNRENAIENARIIHSLGPKIVCLTQGKLGGIVYESNGFTKYNAFKVKPIDTTGAGDCFAAGFIYGYLNKWENSKSAKFGSAVAAINSLSFGGHDGAPTLDQVNQFIADNPQ